MSKTTRIFGQRISVSPSDTGEAVKGLVGSAIDQFIELENDGWDIDWAGIRFDTEISRVDNFTLSGERPEIMEWNTISMEVKGRK